MMTRDSAIREYNVGQAVVHPWHLDQFGHMNVRWYAHFFDDASLQFLALLRLSGGNGALSHCVTARATTSFSAEVMAGTCIRILGSIAKIGTKSVTLEFRMIDALSARDYAHCETVEVFVDAQTHQSIEIPSEIRSWLEESRFLDETRGDTK